MSNNPLIYAIQSERDSRAGITSPESPAANVHASRTAAQSTVDPNDARVLALANALTRRERADCRREIGANA
jgi:hypothetical protein